MDLPRSVTISTVSKVTTNANTGAGTMRKSALALVPDALGEVSKTNTTANRGDASGIIKLDVLERLEEYHYIRSTSALIKKKKAKSYS